VTEIVTYPRKKVCNIFLGGGDKSEIIALHPQIEAWAKENGCLALTISGRKGWIRQLAEKGWKPGLYSVEKELE